MSYVLEYIQTDNIPVEESGNNDTIQITFKCENFTYYAHCFNRILQYVKGERPESYMSWPVPPTNAEIEAHDERRHIFNQDHEVIQSWIDTL